LDFLVKVIVFRFFSYYLVTVLVNTRNIVKLAVSITRY